MIGKKINKPLKFVADLDNSPLKKKIAESIKELRKLHELNGGSTPNAPLSNEIKLREQVIKQVEKQKIKQEELNKAIQAQRKPAFTAADTRAEIEAYRKGKAGDIASGTVVNSAQIKAAAEANDAYARSINKGTIELSKQINPTITLEILRKKLANAKGKLALIDVKDTEAIELANSEIIKLEGNIQRVTNAGRKGFDNFGRKIIDLPVGALEKLKAQLKSFKEISLQATDSGEIANYNKKIQETEAEIGRLSNVGKQGFDKLGNAVKGSTGFFTKAIQGVFRLAYLLPGIGVAGILAFAIDPIANYIKQLDIFKDKVDETAKAKQALADVGLKGTQDAQKELTTLRLLYNQYQNGNLPLHQRKTAYDQLQKLYPAYFGNLAFEQSASLKTKVAYDSLTTSILATARARAAADKITENETRKLGNEATTVKDREERIKLQQKLDTQLKIQAAEIAAGVNSLSTAQRIYDVRNKIAEVDKRIIDRKTDSNRLDKQSLKLAQDVEAQVKKGGKLTDINPDSVPVLKKIKSVNEEIKRQQKISDLQGELETTRLKKSLEEQKELYRRFEQDKERFGLEFATKRYQGEIDLSKTYLQKLQEQQSKLYAESSGQGFSKQKQERLNFVNDQIKQEVLAIRDGNDKKLQDTIDNLNRINEAIANSKDLEKKINESYYRDLAALKAKYTGKELAQKEAQRADLHKKELEGVRKIAFEETKLGKALTEDLFFMTRSEIKRQIAELKKLLKDPNLTPAERQSAEQGKQQAEDLLGQTTKVALVSKDVSEYSQQASNSFKAWGDAVAGTNDKLAYTLNSLGDLASITGELATAFSSGNPLSMIAGVIKAAASLFSIGKKTRQMNEAARAENQKFYDEAVKGELDYQALLRQRERDTVRRGKTTYQGIIAELELIKSKSPELQKAYDDVFNSVLGGSYVTGKGYKHGTWFRKAKTWDIMAALGGSDYNRLEELDAQGKLTGKTKEDFDKLKKLREEIQAAGIDVENLTRQLNEMLTGTSVEGLSNGLAQLFENGKTSAEDFGNSFEDVLKKAISNTFKYKYIEQQMQPLYDALIEAGSDGVYSQNEIDALREKSKTISEDLKKQWEVLTGALDINFGTDTKTKPTDTALSGAIKGITADQADLLAGQFGGLRIAQLEGNEMSKRNASSQLAIMSRQLNSLIAIERNTGATADNTKQLKRLEKVETSLISIDRKMGASNSLLEANGL